MPPRSSTRWREQLGVAGVLAGAVILIWLGSQLTPAKQVVLWALLVLALAALGRRGWLKLFGPVFYYDLLRGLRKNRTFVFRFLYAGLLCALMGWIYFMWALERRGGMLDVREMPEFTSR